jgi:hypothetical protein
MLTTLLAMSFIAYGPAPVTNVRPAAEIIEIRPGMLRPDGEVGREVLPFSRDDRAEVVAAIADGVLIWESSVSDRERLGGQDAPELILVRVFDAVFAIDPFAPLPEGGIGLMRQLLRPGTSLELDRSLFSRRSIQRTEELMDRLEHARHEWLRINGFYGPRTYTNPNAGARDGASLPEPAGWFRAPEDMPRTRSREQVQADPTRDRNRAIAVSLFSGDEPVRISLPFGTASDVVASVERRNQEEIASR